MHRWQNILYIKKNQIACVIKQFIQKCCTGNQTSVEKPRKLMNQSFALLYFNEIFTHFVLYHRLTRLYITHVTVTSNNQTQASHMWINDCVIASITTIYIYWTCTLDCYTIGCNKVIR